MHKLAAAFALLASPALATGLEIEIEGEGANGTVMIDLFEDMAPKHVEQITALAAAGQYDGVVFHRVIDGFMAQTGDVEHGRLGSDMRRAGTAGRIVRICLQSSRTITMTGASLAWRERKTLTARTRSSSSCLHRARS